MNDSKRLKNGVPAKPVRPSGGTGDRFFHDFQRKRIQHWDRVAPKKSKEKRPGSYYHSLIRKHFQFIVPPGMRVLELGCGQGDLLAALRPSFGVGVDFSEKMLDTASGKHKNLLFLRADAQRLPLRGTFDYIVVSDLLNDLFDVQKLLIDLHQVSSPSTRIVINFFSNLWRLPLEGANFLKIGGDVLEQSWLAPHDIFNLLHVTDFDIISHTPRILFPLYIPFISNPLNRYGAHLPILNWFNLTNIVVARQAPDNHHRVEDPIRVSIVVPARNEEGNIGEILRRTPRMGQDSEILFVEGGSSDNTLAEIESRLACPDDLPMKCRLFQQTGKGKGDAVRLGFEQAEGDMLMILDADMTVPPEDLPRFFQALVSGKGEFINGVRLVYPMENQSMRFINMMGNKFFSLAFSWILNQPIKDTLCGTKVLWGKDYRILAKNREFFGNFDPYGDFDLLFGASKANLKMVDIPIRYRQRTYGETNIDRWTGAWLLFKMVVFGARKIKFL